MKIIGSILIVLASIFSSYYYEKNHKCDISKIENLIELINYIKSKIEYYSLPIEEILKNYDNKSPWIEMLINRETIDAKNFNENTKNDILNFFFSIGKGYKKEQLSLCEYTIRNLNKELERMKTEFIKKTKIYRSLSLFFGVGLVILII